MNLTEVKKKAKECGVTVGKMNKLQIIQAIQVKENNFPCYGTSKGQCDQEACLWRQDCLAV